jgi:ABC-type sugar transport system ATPase subunit
MNFITGSIGNAESAFIPTSQGKRLFKFKGDVDPKYVGSEVTLGVRPQQIKVYREEKDENSIPCSVRITEFQGETTVLTLNLGDGAKCDVRAVVAATERYSMGDTVWLYFSPDIIHLFDEDVPILRRRAK